MKTLGFVLSSSLILLLAFWLTSPRVPVGLAHRGSEVVMVPAAEAQVLKPGPRLLAAGAPRSKLKSAIDADNVCETARIVGAIDITNPREAASLMSAIGAPPALQELFAENGPLAPPANAGLSSYQHPLSRLILALSLSGLYPGADLKHGDLPRARMLLLALEKSEPDNAAYPFFLLDVEKRLGAPPTTLAKIAARAAKARRFETYLASAQASIQANRFVSASAFAAIESLLQGMDSANFYSPGHILQDLDRAGGTTYAEEVGTLMQQPGMQARRGAFFYDFSAREFDAGRELRGNHGPDAASLSLKKEGLPAGFTYPTGGWLEEDGTCDEARFEEDFRALRNFV